MNNRQKAKHFKRLYEMGLPKKPYFTTFIKHIGLKHYGVATSVPYWYDCPICRVEDNLIHNLRDILKKNIKEETRDDGGKRYYLDIWMEG